MDVSLAVDIEKHDTGIARAAGYVSPYGKPRGLRARLAKHVATMRTDRNKPWLGTGIVADLESLMKLLSLREFGEWLRTHGPAEHREWADAILEADDAQFTVEAVDSAVRDRPEKDVVQAVEGLADDYAAVRQVLVETGALDAGDKETPVADLLRALLA